MSPIYRSKSDYTMMSRRWSEQRLVSAETALALARNVHTDVFGKSDLDANEPLTVQESGDVWIVKGSKSVELRNFLKNPDGPLVMRISKYDSQILGYYFEMPSDKETVDS